MNIKTRYQFSTLQSIWKGEYNIQLLTFVEVDIVCFFQTPTSISTEAKGEAEVEITFRGSAKTTYQPQFKLIIGLLYVY